MVPTFCLFLAGRRRTNWHHPSSHEGCFHLRQAHNREYPHRRSYIEICDETIIDLLTLPSSQLVQIEGTGPNVCLSRLREEVATNFSSVKKVLYRGYANRKTASTDWSERGSRSHSVFRVAIESRGVEMGAHLGGTTDASGRITPTGRMTFAVRPVPSSLRSHQTPWNASFTNN